MMAPKIHWFLFLFIPFHFYAQQDEQPLDTAALMAMAQEFRNIMLADFKPSPVVQAPEFSRIPIPEGLNAAQIKEALNYYSGAFYFGPGFNPNELLVESDNFFFPDARHIQVSYQWTKALDGEGHNYLDLNNPDNRREKQNLEYLNTSQVKLNSEPTSAVTVLEGDFSLTIPTRYEKIILTLEDLNKNQKLNKLGVRLFRLEKDIAGVWVAGDAARVAVYPMFNPILPLATSSVTTLGYDPQDQGIDTTLIPPQPEKGTLILVKAKGVINHLAVVFFSELSTQKVKIKATPTAFVEGDAGAKERYIFHAALDYAKLATFNAETVRLATTFALKEHTMMGEEQAQWEFEVRLPPMIQSKYARAWFKNLKVYHKKKLVSVTDTTGYFDETDMTLATIPENEAYEKVPYDRITGIAMIKIPTKIQTLRVKKGEQMFGVTNMQANEVTVLDEAWDEDLQDIYRRSGLSAFRAYGKGKFPLKKGTQESYEYKDDVGLRKYYFYGPVNSVQLDQPTEWILVEVPFDISKAEPVNKKSKGNKKG